MKPIGTGRLHPPDGKWTMWDEDGSVVRETRYKDGKKVQE